MTAAAREGIHKARRQRARAEAKAKPNGPTTVSALAVTQSSLARRLIQEYGERIRYDNKAGYWFLWDGTRWARNETRQVFDWARALCEDFGVLHPKMAATLEKHSCINGVEQIASHDQIVSVVPILWDRDPYLLGTQGGTVNLRNGTLMPAVKDQYITRQTAVAPAPGPCPRWMKLMNEWCKGDAAMLAYLQIVSGYCLTGLTIEHALFFLYGPGGNGKSVWLNTIAGIMADYATTAPMETFTTSRYQQHPTDLASLAGARMVSAVETEEGRKWAEARIKQITGGDKIAARFMRMDFFEYLPQFKLVVIGNHKPILTNIDDATKRRFHMVPFVHKPPTVEKRLTEQLREEWPQILQWMIDGAVIWNAKGLAQPPAVVAETQKYFDDEDTFGQWLEDKCDCEPEGKVLMTDTSPAIGVRRCAVALLFASWKGWCLKNGEPEGSVKRFSKELEKRGFVRWRDKATRKFVGLELQDETPPVASDSWQSGGTGGDDR